MAENIYKATHLRIKKPTDGEDPIGEDDAIR